LPCVAVCCSVLQCVAVCCRVLQCVAVCCRVLQCVAGAFVSHCTLVLFISPDIYLTYISVLQCGVVCCSVLQCVTACCRVLPCVAVCCSVLQRVAVCCRRLYRALHRLESLITCNMTNSSALQYGAACCLIFVVVSILWDDWMVTITHVCMRYVTDLNESCHTYEWGLSQTLKIYDTCEWVMSHIWMSHVTHVNDACHVYEEGMSHTWMIHITRMNASRCTHLNASYYTCEITDVNVWKYEKKLWKTCEYVCIIWHMWKQHVAHMNESCLTYEWVMSHVCMNHVSHMTESWHTYECVKSHTCMRHDAQVQRHVTLLHQQYHAWVRVTSHLWMRHVTHMNDSYHTYQWFMSHLWMRHITLMNRISHVTHVHSHVTHMNEPYHTY